MKRRIASYPGSNMAGFSWRWDFHLQREDNGRYTLSCRQVVKEDDPHVIEPTSDLKDGVDIYSAFLEMIKVAGFSEEKIDEVDVSNKIARFGKKIAQQFRDAAGILEARHEEGMAREKKRREEFLEPFKNKIENYLSQISDAPGRFPGSSSPYPSRRTWMRLFIEEYIIKNKAFPVGWHEIRVVSGSHTHNGSRHYFEKT
jgi:hypothetical protein